MKIVKSRIRLQQVLSFVTWTVCLQFQTFIIKYKGTWKEF